MGNIQLTSLHDICVMMQVQPNYHFRKATLKDVLFFYEAMCSLEDMYIDDLEFGNNFKFKMEDASSHLLVIEERDAQQMVGCVVVQSRKNLSDSSAWMEIQELYIVPKFRKFKAADFLYQQLELYVKEISMHKLKVACRVNSTLNQNFYTKKGFKIEKKTYGKFI